MTRMNWMATFSAVALLSVSACSKTGPEPADVAPASPPAAEAEAPEAEETSPPAAAEETSATAEEPVASMGTPAESAGATETSAKTEGGRVLGAIGRALRKSVAAGAEGTPNSAPPFGP